MQLEGSSTTTPMKERILIYTEAVYSSFSLKNILDYTPLFEKNSDGFKTMKNKEHFWFSLWVVTSSDLMLATKQ